MIEVEMRAKLGNESQKNLEQLANIRKIETKHQIDTYLQHKQDTKRELVIRFRKSDTDEVLLTFKGKQQTSNTTEDIARPEYETRISNADTLINLLLTSGYETLVIIDKIRQSYTYNAMEINIDEIKGLGSFIEVELLVAQENDIDDAKKQIIAFFQTLAIDKSHIIHKGYVPLCLEAGIK